MYSSIFELGGVQFCPNKLSANNADPDLYLCCLLKTGLCCLLKTAAQMSRINMVTANKLLLETMKTEAVERSNTKQNPEEIGNESCFYKTKETGRKYGTFKPYA